MIEQGCEVFLAMVVALAKQLALVLAQIPVVNEFDDVFPNELPRQLLAREVEFAIDLVPSTKPISRALYWIASLELRELKTLSHG